jgi:hypothetical protein
MFFYSLGYINSMCEVFMVVVAGYVYHTCHDYSSSRFMIHKQISYKRKIEALHLPYNPIGSDAHEPNLPRAESVRALLIIYKFETALTLWLQNIVSQAAYSPVVSRIESRGRTRSINFFASG